MSVKSKFAKIETLLLAVLTAACGRPSDIAFKGSEPTASPRENSGRFSLVQPELVSPVGFILDLVSVRLLAYVNDPEQYYEYAVEEPYLPGDGIFFDAVLPGRYLVDVTVLAEGQPILTGSSDVSIAPGQAATAEVVLNPVDEFGSVEIILKQGSDLPSPPPLDCDSFDYQPTGGSRYGDGSFCSGSADFTWDIPACDMKFGAGDDSGNGYCTGTVTAETLYSGSNCDGPHCGTLTYGDGHSEEKMCDIIAVCVNGVITPVAYTW